MTGLYDLIQRHTDTMAGGGGGQHENFDETSKIWSGMDLVAELKHAGAGTEQLVHLKVNNGDDSDHGKACLFIV